MALLLRQVRTLTYKNLLITLYRHWLATPIRALLLPVLIVLLLSFTQNFISPSLEFGIGQPRPIRPLNNILNAVSGKRNRIVFVTSSFTGGDIETVIGEVASPLKDSGIDTVVLQREVDLRTTCISTVRGSSRCIAAVVFHSSPTEGESGVWNYTLRADGALGTDVHVNADTNAAQVYTLPLQHAIDFAASRLNDTIRKDVLDRTVYEYAFTSKTQEERTDDTRRQYMNMISNVLAAPFYIAVACITYQLTGFIATERETGMAQLLDTMMAKRSRWQPQVARLLSHHLAFDMLYSPGWIAAGAILGGRCFPRTSIIIPIAFNLLAGLSTTSFGLFMASFFRKAQLSGIVAIIASLLLAILAQVSAKAGTAVIVVLSFIFPPMNYVFFVVLMARWQKEDRPLNLFKSAPNSSFAVPGIVFFIFAVYQTLVYPVFGALIERTVYGTASSSRKTLISDSSVAVDVSSFTKEYNSGFMARMLARMMRRPLEPVLAVNNLSLQAYRGEILVLLGANGSGKSTTLDAIAGIHSVTSGEISLNHPDNAHTSFGYCPQKNILWDDLTVREHVHIFDSIKCGSSVITHESAENTSHLSKDMLKLHWKLLYILKGLFTRLSTVGKVLQTRQKTASKFEIDELLASCDLAMKRTSLAKSLSGGQKRKLQMAMMFAGGSTICCIDEVSSGVDPLSRRKLWDILLAERGRRSFILTTHFLDEADLLADRISILSQGSLRVSGTPLELKHRLGSGYRVHVQNQPGTKKAPLYSDILYTEHGQMVVYLSGTSTETHRFLERLDRDGIQDYQVNAPTLEDVFFKVEEQAKADNDIGNKSNKRSSWESLTPLTQQKPELELLNGKVIGMLKQIKVLLGKRFIVFRRNPIPYIVLLAIPIIAAGCSTLFLKNVQLGSCNPEQSIASANDGSVAQSYRLVAGPREQLSEAALQRISEAPPGAVTMVDTLDQFNAEVRGQHGSLIPGGFFLDTKPTLAWRADGSLIFPHVVQNLLDSLLTNVTITSNYQALDIPFTGSLSGLLLFIAYFGLSMAVYPAFLALYPTIERLRGVRAMHYSNGVRATPLWLAYLIFDSLFIILVSILATMILAASRDIWYAMAYLLLIFLLYGIASTLYSYTISLFSSSQLAAFAIVAGSQAVFFLIYFIVFMVVVTYVDASNQISTLNIASYTLGIVSPVCSFARALYVALNVFGVSCRDRRLASYPGAFDLFGAPILYLILQSLILFGILFWKESGSGLSLWSRKKTTKAGENTDIELEAPVRFGGITRASEGLLVQDLRKQFKKHVAVDDVTFDIGRSECFALIGPNGAGKSTTISMIRGDLQPSGKSSQIFIDGISALKHRGKARARLGVCPQIDPLDTMTVAEHLRFYAEIRGISNPSHNMQAIMNAVGLERFANRIATKLSGGNKRKLSLGIALMGNPSVLLLDEPSSGMDAVSKRVMWRTLASITPGRSLLLTTHSMEEADALASRAGFISGRMLALGTTNELRQSYGNAYFIHLVHGHAPHTRSRDMERIKGWVQGQFTEARIEKTVCYGQLKFEIPLSGIGTTWSLSGIFGCIEAMKESLGVQYYSVSTATLDQIFLGVVGRHSVEEEDS